MGFTKGVKLGYALRHSPEQRVQTRDPKAKNCSEKVNYFFHSLIYFLHYFFFSFWITEDRIQQVYISSGNKKWAGVEGNKVLIFNSGVVS